MVLVTITWLLRMVQCQRTGTLVNLPMYKGKVERTECKNRDKFAKYGWKNIYKDTD